MKALWGRFRGKGGEGGESGESGPQGSVSNDLTSQAGVTFQNARAAKMRYDALNAKIDLEVKAGKLVEVAQVQALATQAGTLLRQHLERLPDQLAAELSVETNESKIHAMLVDQIETALGQISNTIAKGLKQDQA